MLLEEKINEVKRKPGNLLSGKNVMLDKQCLKFVD